MIKRKSEKKTLLHPIDITKELYSALGEATPTINVKAVVSSKALPKSLRSVLICLEADEIERLEKKISLLKRSKKRIAQMKLHAEKYMTEVECLTSENHALNSRNHGLEEQVQRLQHNLEIVNKNLNDRELLIRSARGEGLSAPSGLGKLSDLGAVGKPLQGGLPSLGKKSK